MLVPERFLQLLGGDGALLPIWVNKGATAQPAIGRQGTSRLGLLADAAWFALLTAFVATLVIAGRALWRRPRTLAARTAVHGTLTWIVVSLVVYCVVLFGQWRYHIAIEPLMILLTASAACAGMVRARGARPAVRREI